MPEFEIPPVPYDRLDRDAEWRALWVLAHVEMGRWGRRPAPSLIDKLLDPDRRDRHWLCSHLDSLALVTTQREHDHEQDDGGLRWLVPMLDQHQRGWIVRIIVNPRTNQVFNAFPDRRFRLR